MMAPSQKASKYQPPYLGAAYYPEDWPAEQVDEDIALMKEAGLNCVRMTEFAWSTFEPEEGRLEFEWLDRVLEKLAEAGIAVVLGTPTATPPVWLVEKHPEILFRCEDGFVIQHGGRRHYDPTNKDYREHSRRITTALAERYGQDDRVIGWQIDNELFGHYSPTSQWTFVSHSHSVREGFQAFLKDRYSNIESLNTAWCTSLWSQTYQRFDQIPLPDSRTWHHPSLRLAFHEFNSHDYVEFAREQADILHRLTNQPVGTNMMPLIGVDHAAMNEFLDVVQFDHYFLGPALPRITFWFDHLRTLNKKPFWNIETASCWAGSTQYAIGSLEPGFCRAVSWLPIALGGEMNSYWLWRTHWAGQELMHGSVVDSHGRPRHIFGEVQEIAQDFSKSGEFLRGTHPDSSGLALHFSHYAAQFYLHQNLYPGFDYLEESYTRLYQPLDQQGWRPDLIPPSGDLSNQKLLISTFLPALDEAGLRERLLDWVQSGGVWIAGPFTDIRTTDGTKFIKSPFGSLEEWTGVHTRYQLPAPPKQFSLEWADGHSSTGDLWFDGFEPRGTETLATYKEGPLEGLAAAVRCPVGKGEIILLGTVLPAADWQQLVAAAADRAGLKKPMSASESVVAVPRSGAAGTGLVAVETTNQEGFVELERPAVNLLTGETVTGRVPVPPYGVLVLRHED